MPRFDLARRLVFLSAAALAFHCLAWELFLAPMRPGGTLLALKALPLAIALPNLARGRIRTYQWWSMGMLLYLCEGVVRGMTDANPLSRVLGWIEFALATIAWFGILAAVRAARTEKSTPASGV